MRIRLIVFIFVILPVLGMNLTLPAECTVPQSQKKMRENISTLMLLRMTRVLDLTEEQAAKIYPKVNYTEKEKNRLNREILQKMRKLRVLLGGENPDEKQIEKTIEDIQVLRDRIRGLDKEFESFLDENLTVLQRGKYLFFVQEFFKTLREQLNKARAAQNKLKRPPKRF
ncbi:MAG: hypothetical protein KAX11_07255 [Candidatus Aminicenantes bacterium]|nr:hypothetical protein [Candidatus Aminicenantes bacterium]